MTPCCCTCRHDVSFEERQRIGPGAPMCRHPEVDKPGFWDRDISECYQERAP
jgi:hypothetical protein